MFSPVFFRCSFWLRVATHQWAPYSEIEQVPQLNWLVEIFAIVLYVKTRRFTTCKGEEVVSYQNPVRKNVHLWTEKHLRRFCKLKEVSTMPKCNEGAPHHKSAQPVCNPGTVSTCNSFLSLSTLNLTVSLQCGLPNRVQLATGSQQSICVMLSALTSMNG